MGHREPGRYRLAAVDVQHAARVVLFGAPSADLIGLGHRGDEGGAAVAYREAVEMATVLAGELGDERRPPARDEAEVAVEGRQAREERVDDPQLGPAVLAMSPHHLVAVDAAGDR